MKASAVVLVLVVVVALLSACAPMDSMFDPNQPGYCLAVTKMKKMSMEPYCRF